MAETKPYRTLEKILTFKLYLQMKWSQQVQQWFYNADMASFDDRLKPKN